MEYELQDLRKIKKTKQISPYERNLYLKRIGLYCIDSKININKIEKNFEIYDY